jgi:hypothetical protein
MPLRPEYAALLQQLAEAPGPTLAELPAADAVARQRCSGARSAARRGRRVRCAGRCRTRFLTMSHQSAAAKPGIEIAVMALRDVLG